MYITTIYSKLSKKQKKKLLLFLQENFEQSKFDFEPLTIIILYILENEIVGCICLYDNKYLLEKINEYNIPLSYYSFNNSHGCFIYNLCVHKDHRNKKIGYNLINYTIEKMLELKINYLHTQAQTEISRILFLKNGFVENNSFIGSNNVKVYVMCKYI